MALNLLKKKVARQGFLKKTASAKGKDEVRGKWQERWFVLQGHYVHYYKRQQDSTPKGTIDLRSAHVDDADRITGVPFTIRIQEAKQVFYYLQASHQQDKNGWLESLRKAANYKVEQVQVANYEPKQQKNSYACFPVYHSPNAADAPTKTVLFIDSDARQLKMTDCKRNRVKKPHPVHHITLVVPPREASRPAQLSKNLWPVACDFRSDNYLTRKVFWTGTKRAAEELASILTQVSQNNFAPVNLLEKKSIIKAGVVQLREAESASGWAESFVLVVDDRAIVYRDGAMSKVPSACMLLHDQDVRIVSDGQVGIHVHTATGEYIFRFPDNFARDEWLNALNNAAASLKSRLRGSLDGETKSPNIRPAAAVIPAITAPVAASKATVDWRGVLVRDIIDTNPSYLGTWGNGDTGQLGLRKKDSFTHPQVVSSLSTKKIRYIAAGARHTAAITIQGHVFMWGDGSEMQLGLGSNLKQTSSPYLVTSIRAHKITRIACGRAHTIALAADGKVWSWGQGNKGQLGTGSISPQGYPKQLQTRENITFRSVFAGFDQSAAVAVDGTPYVWGCNTDGRLGLGHFNDVSLPSPALGSVQDASARQLSAVALGATFTVYLTTDGKLYSCGQNDHGQLGLGNNARFDTPTLISSFSNNGLTVRTVGAGRYHAVAIVDGAGDAQRGVPFCWGKAVYNGFQLDQTTPTEMKGLAPVCSVVCSETHSLVVSDDLRVFAFGSNEHGELGNNQPFVTQLCEAGLTDGVQVCQVAAGDGYSVVLAQGSPPPSLSSSAPKRAVEQKEAKSGFSFDARQLEVGRNVDESLAGDKIGALLNAVAGMEVAGMNAQVQPTPTQPTSTIPTPPDDDAIPPPPAQPEAVKEKKKKKKKKKPLWREVFDDRSGRPYYYNSKTRETRWIKPSDEEMALMT